MTPDKHTNQEFFLDVGDGHSLYVHDWGNPDAKTPIIFLHGGPGNGSNDRHKSFFDPKIQRVIFYDQRGAGKSIPSLSLRNNDTSSLLTDIDQIINHLKLKKVTIAGGSWGSCLALLYAIKNPDNIRALVVWGIFMGTSGERDWLFKGAFRNTYPDIWESYLNDTPAIHHDDPTGFHLRNIVQGNAEEAKRSAFIYESMEYGMLRLDDRVSPVSFDEYEPGGIKIEAHFASNNHFLEDNFILNNLSKLTMPVWIVQGRYDMVCPPSAAYELHKKLANSRLNWTTAGHSGNNRANYDVIKAIFASLGAEQA